MTELGPPAADDFSYVPPSGPSVAGIDAPDQTEDEVWSYYANFGSRFGAWVLDTLVLAFALGVAWFVLGRVLPREEVLDGSCVFDVPAPCSQPTNSSLVAIFLLSAGIYVLYFAFFDGVKGQTIGKRVVGIYVMDHTGAHIGLGRGLVRAIARVLSSLPVYLGYLWHLWEPRGRTWHDIASGSVVVKV